MKTRLRISCLLLAALMLFALAACGKDSPESSPTPEGTEQTKPPAQPAAESTINTPLWDLSYDEADGSEVINAEIRVSVEGPYNFRDYLTSFGFDEYEYAVNPGL